MNEVQQSLLENIQRHAKHGRSLLTTLDGDYRLLELFDVILDNIELINYEETNRP